MRFLLIVSISLLVCSSYSQESKWDRLPRKLPPRELGITFDDVRGKDMADSVARLELRGYIIYPDFLFGSNRRNPSLSYNMSSLWLRNDSLLTTDHDTLYLGFTMRRDVKKAFPGEFRYECRGLKIFKQIGFDRWLIYRDSLFFAGTSDTISVEIPTSKIYLDGEDGHYKVTFNEITRIDSKNRRFSVPEDFQYEFGFTLEVNHDPLAFEYGEPRPILIVDGQIYHEGDFIEDSSEVYLSIIPSPNFEKKYPKEQNYQIRGMRIWERMHRGGETRYEFKGKSEWGSPPMISIPMDSIVVKDWGEFGLVIPEIFRMNSKGEKFRIRRRSGNSVWNNDGIKFRKRRPK